MIKDYKVVKKAALVELVETVKRFIGLGWQPFGSLVVDGQYRYQAMIKYEEQEKDAS